MYQRIYIVSVRYCLKVSIRYVYKIQSIQYIFFCELDVQIVQTITTYIIGMYKCGMNYIYYLL